MKMRKIMRKKLSITLAAMMFFTTTGNLIRAAEIEKFDTIAVDKSGYFGSTTITDMEKNLTELDSLTNKEHAYKKIILLQLWRNREHFGGPGNSVANAMRGRLATIIKYQIYNGDKDWQTSEAFKQDMKDVNRVPHVTHAAVADLANYLPKILDKGDEIIDQVNKNTVAIDTKADKTEVYTKTEVDTELDKKANKDDVYTKTESDARFVRVESTTAINTNTLIIHEERINILEERVEKLDSKVDAIGAMSAAMSSLDLGDVPTGQLGIGVSVGASGKGKAVAAGLGFAPTDNFKLNAKFSSTTGKTRKTAVGAGAVYFLKLK